MNQYLNRRVFLTGVVGLLLACSERAWSAENPEDVHAKKELQKLERDLDGRLGVFVWDTGNSRQLSYRANERFPVCSTFKLLVASAILRQSTQKAKLMEQVVRYDKSNLVAHSPITEKHVGEGMTVAALCAAALQYSDNTAGNLLMRIQGGPQGVTKFARSLGDARFRLDRWETALNTAIPGDERDTSTPMAMGNSIQRLVLGDRLQPAQRAQLREWLLGNTTGGARIKAGIPSSWRIGDKTGGGDYGTANDLAVVWPPNRKPVIMAVYTTRYKKDAEARNDIIAAAARVIVEWAR